MDCPRCKQRNSDDARFCESCGAAFALLCSSCGREVRGGARFCSGCGRALEASAAVEPAPGSGSSALPEREGGERRQLTVLFCDLVRSSELAARLDPEDWGGALAAYQKAGDAVITRHGGHVAQHLGDGLLAYFGWPRAMDDAAERAVRAGLALLDAAAKVKVEGAGLVARVGLHTGAVVMGELGEGSGAETLALGDVPNVAARVQAAASPGTVVMSASTQRLVAGLFVIEELGRRALPGAPEPVLLYRVRQASGVRGRIHAAATASRLTRFVGRELERQLLRERWELAQEGEGQVVLITGEPGIGKSRLVQQLKEDLSSAAHSWIESACSPYLQHAPFAPIAEQLVQGFRWPAELSMEARIASLERVLEAMGMTPPKVMPLLAPLLGLELPRRYPPLLAGPEEQRRRLLATLVEWTLASARLQPTVVVMEDLHWMDASTLELEGLLVDQIATARVLLLLTARPEFRAPWPLRAHHAQLSLARLNRHQTRELIGAVTLQAIGSSDLIETLVARTDGVPLFVEELTRAVIEAGAASPREIPTTLQDTLMARLDRLGEAKAVAQVGAVLGREFARSVLIEVSGRPTEEVDAALSRLCDAELLHARGLGPEATYVFKHALVQQAAYESLLKSRRRELHRRAGEVLSRIPDSPAALLAHHWESAGDAQQAVAAWQVAAEGARHSAASYEAAEYFRRALAVLSTLPESPERDRQELALQYPLMAYLMISRGTEDPELHTARARARELAERANDARMTVRVLGALWGNAFTRGELRSALASAEQMLDIGEREKMLGVRMSAHSTKAACHLHLGELAASRHHAEQVIELFEPDVLGNDVLDPRVLALSSLAQESALTGRIAEARRHEADMLSAIGARGIATDIAIAGLQALGVARLLREPERAVERSAHLLSFCSEHKIEALTAVPKIHAGWGMALGGDGNAGVALLREGLLQAKMAGMMPSRGQSLGMLAEAEAAAGHIADALATLDDALHFPGEAELFRPDLLRLRGDLLVQQGDDLDAAEAAYREAIERASAIGALLFELRAATGLARLLQLRSRATEAREALAPVYARFTEGFELRDLVEAKALLDELG